MGDAVLTDRLLRSWLRCHRRAWLDRHQDPADRRWSAHRALQLLGRHRAFAALSHEPPGRGLEGCRSGARTVVGLRLKGRAPGGLPLEAHPPLLQRRPGASRWGPFHYRPVLARQGRRITREHRLLLALWGRLLEDLQQAPVPRGLVLSGEGGQLVQERVSLGEGLQRQLDTALTRLAADLGRAAPPPLLEDRRKCTLCSWRGHCAAEAARCGHLGEVSGIGARRRDMLVELGIHSLADLAARDPDELAAELERHGEQHRQVAPRLVRQARVQAGGSPLRCGAGPALPELAHADGVLLYDIESDPDLRQDFLHGFVRLPRGRDGRWRPEAAAYHPLLVLPDHGEAHAWRRIGGLLERYAAWPVLHYGETEALALLRMAARQGCPEADRGRLRHRLVDVHGRLRHHWLLPVNGYGLKPVATWLGFRWRQRGVEGARALLWWRLWRGNGPEDRGSRRLLRRIFQYNHDDCLATWRVAAWLLDQDPGGATNPDGTDIARVSSPVSPS